MNDVLMFALPVVFASMGEVVYQRSGQLNIGLEGQMLLAAYFGFAVTQSSGQPWFGLLAGVIAAILAMSLQGLLVIRLGCDAVVTGVGVNLLALGLTSSLFRARMKNASDLLTVEKLPRWNGFDPMTLLALVVFAALLWVMLRSRWGLEVRACGERPDAAASSGVPVHRRRWQASWIAAVLAGLGGAYLSLGITGAFVDNMTGGRGFIVIALVAFGRWNLGWVVLGCLGFGYASGLGYRLQALGSKIPHQVFNAAPYVLALAVLILAGRGRGAPASLGLPYRDNREAV